MSNYQLLRLTNRFDVAIQFQVFDPAQGRTVTGQKQYPGNSLEYWVVRSLATAEGLVAWRATTEGTLAPSDTEIGLAVYDPARGKWIQSVREYLGASFNYWEVTNPGLGRGTAAWVATKPDGATSRASQVAFAAYDPARGAWIHSEYDYSGSSLNYWAPTNVTLRDGIVSWLAATAGSLHGNDAEVRYAFYDPIPASWMQGGRPYQGTSLNFWVLDNLTVADDIVAWRAATDGSTQSYDQEVGYAIYDASRSRWRQGYRLYDGTLNNRWTTSTLTIADHTLQWVTGRPGQILEESRGYHQPSGTWFTTPTTPFALFTPSLSQGAPPLSVWFCDLSLGANNWLWNFGDGTTSTQRDPYHVFNQPGQHLVNLTVTGPAGTNSYGLKVTVQSGSTTLLFEPASWRMESNAFHGRLTGLLSNQPTVLWASTNLIGWQPILTNPGSTATWDFSDPLRPGRPTRFYRATTGAASPPPNQN